MNPRKCEFDFLLFCLEEMGWKVGAFSNGRNRQPLVIIPRFALLCLKFHLRKVLKSSWHSMAQTSLLNLK